MPVIDPESYEGVVVDPYRVAWVTSLLPNCCTCDRFGWLNEHVKAVTGVNDNKEIMAEVVDLLINTELTDNVADLLSVNRGCALNWQRKN